MAPHKFSTNQLVEFVGGTGVVVKVNLESGIWTYTVAMPMQPEPPMGRIGAETWLLLHETEINSIR